MKLTIITNLPSLIATIYPHNSEPVQSKRGGASAIPCYANLGNDPKETVEEIVFDNLPNGLYQLRLLLPYDNAGTMFPMPVMMDDIVMIKDEDKTVTFKATYQK